MHSPATTAATTLATPFITLATTPATSPNQHEHNDTPNYPRTKPPALANDFYLDTLFSPVWMSGPHVFSFANDGAVVRPDSTNAQEPYPGYHADRLWARRLESVNAPHFQGLRGRDPKPWKNVAITEQDDAEFAAFQERVRAGAVGEWRGHPLYEHAQRARPEEPGLAYTWPPMGGNGK